MSYIPSDHGVLLNFERILDSLYHYPGEKTARFCKARDMLVEEYGREAVRRLVSRYVAIGLDTDSLTPEDEKTRRAEDIAEKD